MPLVASLPFQVCENEPSFGATSSFLIIGAGVFGLSSAIALKTRFPTSTVTILDKSVPPTHSASSTDINKIVRIDYGYDSLYTALAARCLPKFREWGLLHECGVVVLTQRQLEESVYERETLETIQKTVNNKRPVTIFQQHEAGTMFRGLNSAAQLMPYGYYNPTGGWANSSATVLKMVEEAENLGVRFVTGDDGYCEELTNSGRRVTGIKAKSGKIWSADMVIVACGAWSGELVPELKPYMTSVGQPTITFKVPRHLRDILSPPSLPVWFADISKTGFYGFPCTPEGFLKFGQHGSGLPSPQPQEDATVPPEILNAYLKFVYRMFPMLKGVEYKTRICWYCDTVDGNFIIGRPPGREGLMVVTGGSGHGFKFAPVLGKVLLQVLDGEDTAETRRFAWRRSYPSPSTEACRMKSKL